MFPPYDKETLEPFTKEKLALISTLPNPTKTMHTTKMLEAVLSDVFGEHEKIFLVDMPVTTDLIRISMSGETRGLKERAILGAAALSQKRFVSKCIKSLRRWEREGKQILFFGFPFGMDAIISAVEKKGLKFNFSGLGFWTVGGWKTYAASLDPEDFRKKGKELFGLSQDCHIDVYMMTEINACIIECKSHYKHIPYLFQPYVLDEEGNPLPPGEYGRFAFLDPLANSYPGFIVTNDRVKLLEHCPGCSRSSLVLSSDISRLKSAEPKGCAAAMGKMLSKAEGMGKEE
jgi:hypothetical protein